MREEPTIERLIYLLRSSDPEAWVYAVQQLVERSSDPVAHEVLYEASFKKEYAHPRPGCACVARCTR